MQRLNLAYLLMETLFILLVIVRVVLVVRISGRVLLELTAIGENPSILVRTLILKKMKLRRLFIPIIKHFISVRREELEWVVMIFIIPGLMIKGIGELR